MIGINTRINLWLRFSWLPSRQRLTPFGQITSTLCHASCGRLERNFKRSHCCQYNSGCKWTDYLIRCWQTLSLWFIITDKILNEIKPSSTHHTSTQAHTHVSLSSRIFNDKIYSKFYSVEIYLGNLFLSCTELSNANAIPHQAATDHWPMRVN